MKNNLDFTDFNLADQTLATETPLQVSAEMEFTCLSDCGHVNFGNFNLEDNVLAKEEPCELDASNDILVPALSPFKGGLVVHEEDDKGRLYPYRLAKFLRMSYRLARKDDVLFLYNEGQGVYVPLITSKGYDSFNGFARRAVNTEEQKYLNRSMLAETYECLTQSSKVVELPELTNEKYVAFANGTLNLSTGELEEHDPRNELVNAIQVDYKRKKAKKIYDTKFWKYLQHLAGYREDVVEVLRLVIGLSCSNIRNMETAFVLYGASHNGKSVFCSLLTQLIGYKNVAHLSVAELGDKYSAAELLGKSLMVSADEDLSKWTQSTVAMFKKVIAGDRISAQKKYGPFLTFKPQALLVCCSNAKPRYSKQADAQGAVSRRIFLVPTGERVSVEDEDTKLIEKLMAEKEIIIAWAMEALISFYEGKKLPHRIVEAQPEVTLPSPDEAVEQWISQRIEMFEGASVTSDELYNDFVASGVVTCPPTGKISFFMKLGEKLGEFKTRHGARGYSGVRLKPLYENNIGWQDEEEYNE